jgi:hypothetical protein
MAVLSVDHMLLLVYLYYTDLASMWINKQYLKISFSVNRYEKDALQLSNRGE